LILYFLEMSMILTDFTGPERWMNWMINWDLFSRTPLPPGNPSLYIINMTSRQPSLRFVQFTVTSPLRGGQT